MGERDFERNGIKYFIPPYAEEKVVSNLVNTGFREDEALRKGAIESILDHMAFIRSIGGTVTWSVK